MSYCSWDSHWLLRFGIPSVWRRDSRWRWRRSRVAPACFPAGSSESSYSRFGSCPRCENNRGQTCILLTSGRCRVFAQRQCHPVAKRGHDRLLAIVPKLLFVAHELDEPVLIGLAPLELQRGAVHHVRLQEQTSGFLVQPVLWRGVFLHDGGEKKKRKIQSQPETSFRGRLIGNLRTLRSMLSRISSMEPCCLMRSMARLGPIPLMVPQ